MISFSMLSIGQLLVFNFIYVYGVDVMVWKFICFSVSET